MKRWLVLVDSGLLVFNAVFIGLNLSEGKYWHAALGAAVSVILGLSLWYYIRSVRRADRAIARLYDHMRNGHPS